MFIRQGGNNSLAILSLSAWVADKKAPALECALKRLAQSPPGCFSGDSKNACDTIGLSTRLRIETWNCAGLSNLTMRSCNELGFDILGLGYLGGMRTLQRSTHSYLLLETNTLENTGPSTADKVRKPTLDAVMRARDRRWNWLGHKIRWEQHRVVRQVLLNFFKPTTDSLFGGITHLHSNKAIEKLTIERSRGALDPHHVADHYLGMRSPRLARGEDSCPFATTAPTPADYNVAVVANQGLITLENVKSTRTWLWYLWVKSPSYHTSHEISK